jgi:hypothetical protein
MLKPYKVSLREDKGDTALTLLFYCMADDPDHAEEQALNAYPNGELINTFESSAEEHPYKVHPSDMEPDVFIDITASVISKGKQS